MIDVDCTFKSDENEPILAKSKAIALVFYPKMTKHDHDRFRLHIEKVMKLSQCWPKSKAIALVFYPQMTIIES